MSSDPGANLPFADVCAAGLQQRCQQRCSFVLLFQNVEWAERRCQAFVFEYLDISSVCVAQGVRDCGRPPSHMRWDEATKYYRKCGKKLERRCPFKIVVVARCPFFSGLDSNAHHQIIRCTALPAFNSDGTPRRNWHEGSRVGSHLTCSRCLTISHTGIIFIPSSCSMRNYIGETVAKTDDMML